jgi:acylphosphatase
MEKARVYVVMEGRVQGVFFRASTRDMAESLGLTGWVKNLADGSVEAVFEGETDMLKRGVQWCYKGPPGAAVTKVHEKWLDYTGEFKQFEITYGF